MGGQIGKLNVGSATKLPSPYFHQAGFTERNPSPVGNERWGPWAESEP